MMRNDEYGRRDGDGFSPGGEFEANTFLIFGKQETSANFNLTGHRRRSTDLRRLRVVPEFLQAMARQVGEPAAIARWNCVYCWESV
jgi:hypothetical protein